MSVLLVSDANNGTCVEWQPTSIIGILLLCVASFRITTSLTRLISYSKDEVFDDDSAYGGDGDIDSCVSYHSQSSKQELRHQA